MDEWKNIFAFQARGIPTMVPLSVGLSKHFGFKKESFLLTREIEGVERLEHYLPRHFSPPLNSYHLKGKAVDVVPIIDYDYPKVRELLWRPDHEIWNTVKEVADSCDMTWGGNWRGFPDYFHLQDR